MMSMNNPYISGHLTFEVSKVTFEPQTDGWAYIRLYQKTGFDFNKHRVCLNIAITDNDNKIREIFNGLSVSEETILVEYIDDNTDPIK